MAIQDNTSALQSLLDTANNLPLKVNTYGTATAADIYTGKTATVNDQKITGTNPWNDENVTPYVNQALAALTEKGVDSSGKGLADLAALIAAIESGGDSVSMVTGTITPATETTTLTITHGLGKIPTLFLVYLTPSFSGSSGKTILAGYGLYNNQMDQIQHLSGGTSTITSAGIANYPDLVRSETNVVFSTGSTLFVAKKYTWIAIWRATT